MSKNLMQRLIDVMAYMGAIGKGGQTSYGEKYAYHKIDDIDDKLRQALIEHGVIAIPVKIDGKKIEWVADESRGGKLTWYAECSIEIMLINADNPEDRQSIAGWGQGLDYSDKATGKAISYAAKAAYLSAFHLRGQPDSELSSISRSQPRKQAVAFTPELYVWIEKINGANSIDKLKAVGADIATNAPTDDQVKLQDAYRLRSKALRASEPK